MVSVEDTTLGSTARVQQEDGIFLVSINAASGIDCLDPALASTPPAWALLDTTCARLLSYPDKEIRKGFRLQPEVAQSLPTISRDGKTYTFRLRSGFRFSDENCLRASAFAREMEALLAPEMNSPGVQFVRDIVGAGRVVTGKADEASGVVARGNTLVVRLTRRAPDFPSRTASTFFCAVPPSLPIDPEGRGAFPAAGPYYVTDYRLGDRVTIRRNRFYGGTQPITSTDSTSTSAQPHHRKCCSEWIVVTPTGGPRSQPSTSILLFTSSRSTGSTSRGCS